MRSLAWLASRELPSPSCPRTCRDNLSQSIRFSTRGSTPSRLHRFTANRKSGRPGRSSSCAWAPRLRSTSGSRPASPSPARWPGRSFIHGRRARRPHRRRLRRAGPPLEADPGCLRGRRLRHLLRDPSERGHFRRRHFRDVPRRRRRAQACLHQLRSVAIRPAAPRLSGIHRHLPRADQGISCQGRRAESNRSAGRLFRFPALGESCGPLPLAGRRSSKLRRRLLEDGAI